MTWQEASVLCVARAEAPGADGRRMGAENVGTEAKARLPDDALSIRAGCDQEGLALLSARH